MPRLRAAAAAVVLLGSVLGPLDPAHAAAPSTMSTADEAPVVADDTVTITQYPDDVHVHVLANDSDPDGGNLQICRVEAPDDTGLSVHVWSDHGEPGWGPQPSGSSYLMVETHGYDALPVGTYTVTYYACDQQLLTPGTLTIKVVRITARPVAGSPGVVRWTNPLDQSIDVLYGKPGAEDADGAVTVPAGSTRDKPMRRTKITWIAIPHDPPGEGDDAVPVGAGFVRDTGYRPAAPAPVAAAPAVAHERRVWQHRHAPRPAPSYDARAAAATGDPSTPDAPPVTGDDRVTVDYYDGVKVPVLANDSDDSPGELGVCRVEVPVDKGIGVVIEPWWGGSDRARSDDADRYLALDVDAARGGTYHLTYWACDKHSLTPATLTVTVRRFPAPRVHRVAGKPGTLDFYNGGYRTVHVQYSDARPGSRSAHLALPAHRHRRIHVDYDHLSYFASSSIGPLGFFQVRHVQQEGLLTRPGRATAPRR